MQARDDIRPVQKRPLAHPYLLLVPFGTPKTARSAKCGTYLMRVRG